MTRQKRKASKARVPAVTGTVAAGGTIDVPAASVATFASVAAPAPPAPKLNWLQRLIAWVRGAGFGEIVAQLAHVGWGGFLCFILIHHHVDAVDASLSVGGFAAGKEIAEALGVAPWEAKQTWLNSSIDALFFFVGIGLFWVSK